MLAVTYSLELEAASLDDVVECSGGVATVAAVIGLVAVHNLLGSELDKLVAGKSPHRLDVLGGRESPAAAKEDQTSQ